MQPSVLTEELIRLAAHDRKFHTFGYAKIFSKRAKWYRSRIGFLTKTGFLIPGFIGILILGIGLEAPQMKFIISLAIVLSMVQAAISLWATLSHWDEEYSYAIEAGAHYSKLNSDFESVAKFSYPTIEELKNKYEKLQVEHDSRTQQDGKHNIEECELRFGMRTALREYKQKCTGCGEIPISHNSTDCDVCGKF